jgi:hypothetical protein
MGNFIDANTAVSLFGGALIVISGGAVFANYILPNASSLTLEKVFYALGTSSIVNNQFLKLTHESSFYLSVPGQLIIPATFMFSLGLRNINLNEYHKLISLLGAGFWGVQSVYWQSQLYGALSAASLVMSLGGFAGALPGMTFIGIDKDSTASLVQTSGALSLAYIMACNQNHFPVCYTEPFKFGMLAVLPFYYYLGNLFLSAKQGGYFDLDFGSTYVSTNIMTCLSFYGGYVIGNSFNIPYISGTAKVMSFLYGVEKYYEVPWSDNMVATLVLGLGLVFSPVGITEYFSGGFSNMLQVPGTSMIAN